MALGWPRCSEQGELVALQSNDLARLSLAGFVTADGGEQRSTPLEETMDEVGGPITKILHFARFGSMDEIAANRDEWKAHAHAFKAWCV